MNSPATPDTAPACRHPPKPRPPASRPQTRVAGRRRYSLFRRLAPAWRPALSPNGPRAILAWRETEVRFGIRDAGFGIRDAGFANRDQGSGMRDYSSGADVRAMSTSADLSTRSRPPE